LSAVPLTTVFVRI